MTQTIFNEPQQIDAVFCDDLRIPIMPKETPEQAAIWAEEKNDS